MKIKRNDSDFVVVVAEQGDIVNIGSVDASSSYHPTEDCVILEIKNPGGGPHIEIAIPSSLWSNFENGIKGGVHQSPPATL